MGNRTEDMIAIPLADFERLRIEVENLQSQRDGCRGHVQDLTGMLYDRCMELTRLKAAIRAHRDQRGDDRCWLDDRELYAALGEGQAYPALPDKCDFLESCARFWEQRRDPAATPCEWGMTLAQLEAEINRLREEARRAYHPDGTWELLDTPEEVVRVRIETAREVERLRGLLEQICDLIGEYDEQGTP